MSTLVNLLLAAVVSILGGEMQQQKEETSKIEYVQSEQNIQHMAYYYNITDDLKFKNNEI